MLSPMSQTTTRESTKATLADRVSANLRAEMAALRKGTPELADALHIGHRAAQRRWSGELPISLNELSTIAAWLGMPVSALMAERPHVKAVA